jgi:peptide/nickel transport system permease protein
MLRFFSTRLGWLLVTVLVVTFLVFCVNEFSPGQVARKILGPYATAQQVEILTERMGLNRPVFIRYFDWLWQTLQGDLGFSTLYKVPVNDILWTRLRNTGILAAIAFALIVPLSVLFGITAGMREGSKLDRTISVASIVTTSIPEFAMGAFLLAIFVTWLGILPGTSPLEASARWSILQQLIMPVMVMVLYDLGYVVRMVRASMVEVMTRPYIRTAVLKGMPYRDVIMKHALRNAMIAPFTVILLQINYLVTGVVVVEAVFGYPGFGRTFLDAALYQDIAMIEAGAMVAVTIAVLTQIIGDFGYMILNPRIRFK